jgi:hypothetical protein
MYSPVCPGKICFIVFIHRAKEGFLLVEAASWVVINLSLTPHPKRSLSRSEESVTVSYPESAESSSDFHIPFHEEPF